MFILIDFSIDALRGGFGFAFLELAFRFLTAERTIYESVGLAVIDSPEYNLFSFINMIIAIYLVFNFVRFVGKILINATGSQALWGAYLVAFGIFGIIELVAVTVSVFAFNESFFFPIIQGFGYLIMNLTPVMVNIF